MGDGSPITAAKTGGPPRLAFRDSAARLGATRAQAAVGVFLGSGLLAALITAPGDTVAGLVVGAQFMFLTAAAWRVILVIAGRAPAPTAPPPASWPHYTVLAALHDEAAVVGQLVENLAALDYPPDRLEGWLVLEADDEDTLEAALAADRPPWLGIMVAPPGRPRTKPRALNLALDRATGELVTIYDAEDDPDPLQLREAAARFMADPGLGALQAPLRIRRRGKSPDDSSFLDRQFAAEYAALFEVVLPGMARLGLPFPLGGTSNHLRMEPLRACGGWDAHNVTEDADMGFRLWRGGWRLDVLRRPTYETPPGRIGLWLPQRTRWLKGYMQTWGVHTRRPSQLGRRGLFALTMTVGLAIVSALAHAPAMGLILAAVLLAVAAGVTPLTPLLALAVLTTGAASGWLICLLGARRAHLAYGWRDMVRAPAYWALLSLAFIHALWRLLAEPHAWDKTPHRPDPPAHAGRDGADAPISRPWPRD